MLGLFDSSLKLPNKKHTLRVSFQTAKFVFQDYLCHLCVMIFVGCFFLFKSPKSCSKTIHLFHYPPELPGIFVGTPNPIWLPSWMCRENRNGAGDGYGTAKMGSLDVGATEEIDFFPFCLLRCWVVAIVFFCFLTKDP